MTTNALRAARWATVAGLVVLGAGVLAGFLSYETRPNYDSMWSIVWARELLDGQAPSLDAYRAPTQHPLLVAVSLALIALGDAAPAALVALTLASFVVLVAAIIRLGAATLGVLAGLVAAALLATRLNFAFLAAFAYVDIPFLALLVWAAALAARGDRPSPIVWALLVAAGLLRPEGWAFALMYAVWAWRGATARQRLGALVAVAAAPALWALSDLLMTGDPLFSWTYTTDSAARFGRNRGLLDLPASTLRSAAESVKPPVLALALVGVGLALWLQRRRATVPLALAAGGTATFALITLQGFSAIPRYFAIATVGLLLFAAYALTGWELLERGTRVCRGWAIAAALVAVAGGAFVAATLNPVKVDAELRLREGVFANLDTLLDDPKVAAGRRCGPISLPNHKLVPFLRWRLDAGPADVVARSDLRAKARTRRGVAIVVRDIPGIRAHTAFGSRGAEGDGPEVVPAPPGFRLVAQTHALTAWARC